MPQVNRPDFKNMLSISNGQFFQVPLNVSKISLIGSGGGGGGGGGGGAGANSGAGTYGGGGGSGGGAFPYMIEIDVVPGQIYNAVIGDGGAPGTGGNYVGTTSAGTAGTSGGVGGDTLFKLGTTTIVTFPGGAAGAGGAGGSDNSGSTAQKQGQGGGGGGGAKPPYINAQTPSPLSTGGAGTGTTGWRHFTDGIDAVAAAAAIDNKGFLNLGTKASDGIINPTGNGSNGVAGGKGAALGASSGLGAQNGFLLIAW